MIETTVSYVGLTVAPVDSMDSPIPATITKARRTVSAGRIRAALSQGQPGQWASDHYTEAQKFTGWNYIAIRAIALQCSQADCQIFQDQPSSIRKSIAKFQHGKAVKRGIEKAYQPAEDDSEPLPTDYPLVRLLKRPNPTQSGASFRYEQALQLGLTGQCLIVNIPNRMGLVVERYVVPTCMTMPINPDRDYPMGAWRISPNIRGTTDPEGYVELRGLDRLAGAVVPAAVPGEVMREPWIQVIRWPHPIFKDDGQSGVSAGALWIDTSDMTDRARWSQLKNGPKPSCAVLPDEDQNPTQDELDAASVAFNSKYSGPDNTGKAIFVSAGEVVPLNFDPVEMAYEQAHRQLGQSIMGLHAVPPVAAGLQEGGSYAAFYASLKQFSHLTVQPTLNLLAEEDTEAIAWQFGEGLTIELEAQAIDDPSVLEQRLATDINGRAITKDELRALRGLPPAKEGGDAWAGNDAAIPLAIGGRDLAGMPKPDEVAVPAAQQAAAPAISSPEDVPVEQDVKVSTAAVLNGAQITAATAIVGTVARGEIPRDSGIGQLVVLFNLTEQQAQQIMGSAGTSTPTTPNPNPATASTGDPTISPMAAMKSRRGLLKKTGPHKYGSTQFNLPEDIADLVLDVAAQIPDSELADDGREDEPHVTIKYGLHTDDPARIIDVLRGELPVTIRIGSVSIFSGKESGRDYDVVKLEVEGDGLRALNSKISDLLAHTDTHSEYNPHVTLAYVKVGAGAKYEGPVAGLTGRSVTLDRVIFSSAAGERTVIPLGGQRAKHLRNGHTPVNRIAALFSPAMQAAVEGVLSSTDTTAVAKAVINDALGSILKDCGTGDGGFKSGNDCAEAKETKTKEMKAND